MKKIGLSFIVWTLFCGAQEQTIAETAYCSPQLAFTNEAGTRCTFTSNGQSKDYILGSSMTDVSFSPNSRWCAIGIKFGGIHLIDENGKLGLIETKNEADVVTIEWARNSDRFFALVGGGKPRIYIIRAQPLELEADFTCSLYDGRPIWSNDSTQIMVPFRSITHICSRRLSDRPWEQEVPAWQIFSPFKWGMKSAYHNSWRAFSGIGRDFAIASTATVLYAFLLCTLHAKTDLQSDVQPA